MADTIRLIRLSYENGVRFKLDTKLDSGAYITILEMDENGDIETLWPDAKRLCARFFGTTMTGIGEVMKQP